MHTAPSEPKTNCNDNICVIILSNNTTLYISSSMCKECVLCASSIAKGGFDYHMPPSIITRISNTMVQYVITMATPICSGTHM